MAFAESAGEQKTIHQLKYMSIMEQNNSDKTQLKIVTDTRLWNLLMQGMKKSEKLTKVEAFNDLLERQRIALLTNDDEYMKGNVLEFSKAWGWDRETVNRFLERLQELDIVTISMAGNRKAIKLNYIV
jgi:hypothetical protein